MKGDGGPQAMKQVSRFGLNSIKQYSVFMWKNNFRWETAVWTLVCFLLYKIATVQLERKFHVSRLTWKIDSKNGFEVIKLVFVDVLRLQFIQLNWTWFEWHVLL